jgi:hypothetical protein
MTLRAINMQEFKDRKGQHEGPRMSPLFRM